MLNHFNLRNLLKLSIIYSLIGFCLYLFTSGKPFTYFNEFGLINFFDNVILSEGKVSIEKYLRVADEKFFFFYFGILFLFYSYYVLVNGNNILFGKKKEFDFNNKDLIINKHTTKNINFYIALAAGLGLFIELAIIRIHSSYFQLFAYFKNVSLLSCFLGLGIGYALGNKKLISLGWVFPLLSIEIILLFLFKNTPLTAYLQNPIAEQWAMGQSVARGIFHLTTIYIFLISIFIFNALCFVPLGQLVAKLMDKTNVLIAYGYNLIGSIIGVALFTLLSFFWTPPEIWITFSLFLLLIFLYNFNIPKFSTLISFFFLLLVLISYDRSTVKDRDFYSPYQNISVMFSNSNVPLTIKSSHIWFQTPLNLSNEYYRDQNKYWSSFYSFPFNIALKKPEKIMIVGSGSGNDVAAALRSDIKEIDAVEIDPVIAELGKKFHPENPYNSKNVNVYVNDARNSIKYAKDKYDLILYSVLDSHSNLSGKGGIRLDSFVYTLESFQEAKTKLKENGYLVLSFAISTKELGIKINKMLRQAFGKDVDPVIFGPYKQKVDEFIEGIYIFVVPKNLKKFNFDNDNFFITDVFSDKEYNKDIDISTDDWPFFYMSKKVYPTSYLLVIFLIFISSLFMIKKTTSLKISNFSPTCFFLGAGFMLMETKGITEVAKIYGGTWIVISVIILVILFMAFLANLFIVKKVKLNELQIYTLLVLSIVFSYFSADLKIENYSLALALILNPLILTVPVFFSGLAFSTELKKIKSSSVALSSNILGALFGGLVEYNSMYFGFKFLYLLAILIYISAFLFSRSKIAKSI